MNSQCHMKSVRSEQSSSFVVMITSILPPSLTDLQIHCRHNLRATPQKNILDLPFSHSRTRTHTHVHSLFLSFSLQQFTHGPLLSSEERGIKSLRFPSASVARPTVVRPLDREAPLLNRAPKCQKHSSLRRKKKHPKYVCMILHTHIRTCTYTHTLPACFSSTKSLQEESYLWHSEGFLSLVLLILTYIPWQLFSRQYSHYHLFIEGAHALHVTPMMDGFRKTQ